MGKIEAQTEERPNYYHGQLLQEQDFLREQHYHVHARRRHNTNLHGAGVVSGFKVFPHGRQSAVIEAGCAIDDQGNELFLGKPVTLDLGEYEPGDRLRIGLLLEEKVTSSSGSNGQKNRIFATCVTIARTSERETGVTLALASLDDEGALNPDTIEYPNRLDLLRPGSITADKLHARLKKGWLRLPFRPFPLANIPAGEKEIPPAFRVGATQALTPEPEDDNRPDKGAAGTMDIPVPPNATRVSRFRIAGDQNQGQIEFFLYTGRWDAVEKKHVRNELAKEQITSSGPYNSIIDIKDGRLDPEYSTLSLWLRGTKKMSVSLVAVEFVYYEPPLSE